MPPSNSPAAATTTQAMSSRRACIAHQTCSDRRLDRFRAAFAPPLATASAALDESELVSTLRRLVDAVMVHATANEITIEIRPSLAELITPGPLEGASAARAGLHPASGVEASRRSKPSQAVFWIGTLRGSINPTSSKVHCIRP